MKNLIILCLNLFLINPVYCQKNDLSVKALRTEYKINPVGIDIKEPRLSWQIQTNQRNTLQTAYEIRAAMRIDDLGKNKNLYLANRKNSCPVKVFMCVTQEASCIRMSGYTGR